MSKSKIALAVALIAAAGSAGAAELLVTSQAAKGANAIAVDFVNDAKAAAFQARIQVPGAEKGNTDVSKCLSGLPAGYKSSSCMVTKSGEITLIVFNAGGGTLPDGLVSVGQIGVRNAGAKGGSTIQVSELLVSDANANEIQAKSTVAK